MADAAEDLDLEIPPEIEREEAEAPPETPQGEEDELSFSFDDGGDAPPQSEEQDTGLVRHLRAELREKERRLKALEAQSQPKPIEVGEKPTLAGCQYEEDVFEAELDAWKDRTAQAKRQEQEAQRAAEEQQKAWSKRVEAVEAQKASLGVKDYDDKAAALSSVFSQDQRALIIVATNDPARMVYTLGKNLEKAEELAKITDPAELIKRLAKLEEKIVTTQRKAPPPEDIARGSAPSSLGADKHLERLEAEAMRTGDRTKVVAYKRQQKARAAS